MHTVADMLATATVLLPAALTLCGMVYAALALLGTRDFLREGAWPDTADELPPVSILKPLKGVDAHMAAALASHCVQQYEGGFELVFGVSSLEDPAVAELARLRVEFPAVTIRLVECRECLGMSGKVSNLAQMLPAASFEHVVVNDSDILVSPSYVAQVMKPFSDANVALVTVPYIGRAGRGVWSRLEALGIATDFFAGVLTARRLEGGMRYGLGSTLATTKSALCSIGGFEALVDELADDYELGARLARTGKKVVLVREVVATGVPDYTLRGFCEHQMRWARCVRDARPGGYVGLGVTHVLVWAMLTVVASGGALWSFTLLSLALLARVAVALTVGVGVLRDGQVLRDLWLLPLRDTCALAIWAWSFAGDEVVWRGETFLLHSGKLERPAR